VATFTTASTYINRIDTAFPTPGQFNNSQGFRDNFKNVKLALDAIDQNTNFLRTNSITSSNPINDFDGNIIKEVTLQDYSVLVYDDTENVQTEDFFVDYRRGNFQKFKINEGTHSVSVENWPGGGKAASLFLSITTSSTATTLLNFNDNNVINLGRNKFPLTLEGPNPHLFELLNDGVSGNLFVKQYVDSNKFTQPIQLAEYTTSTLVTLTNVEDGSIVFLSGDGYNRPAFYSGGTWYIMTGTSVVL